MGVTIHLPGGQPSAIFEQEHTTMASDVIDSDGIYADQEGNRFQFRNGHVLAPGQKKLLKRVGDFPVPGIAGGAELASTVATGDDLLLASAKAAAEAEEKAAAKAAEKAAKDAEKAAAKAAQEPENKAEQAPENKS